MADLLALFLPQGGWWGLLVGFAAEVVRGWLADRASASAARESGAREAQAKGMEEAERQEQAARQAKPEDVKDDELFRDEPAKLVEEPIRKAEP